MNPRAAASYKDVVTFLYGILRKQRGAFLYVIFVSLVWSLDATVWPYLFRLVIDGLSQHESMRERAWDVIRLPVYLGVGLWLLIEAGFRTQGFVASRLFPRLEADIRMAMFDHVQHHSPKYFADHFAGSLANSISDMTIHVTNVLQNLVFIFLPGLATALLGISFFAALQPQFALFLGVWICAHITINILCAKKCGVLEHAHGEARSKLVGSIIDSFQNSFSVNLFYRFPSELQRMLRAQRAEEDTHVQARRFVEKTRLLMGVCTFLIGGLAINASMLYSWMNGTITTGEVTQIFNTNWNVIMVMWVVGTSIPSFFQSLGLLRQAFQVMHDPQDLGDIPEAKPLVTSRGEIVFNNVSFQHGEKQLFHNKSLQIPGGQKVGLVGYSGAGKSTFVNLILRLFPIDKGSILIDGQDISAVTLESLRSQVALIPQDPSLFHRTLKENIRFGREDATDSEIIEAAKRAHAHEFISRLRHGYDTVIGERGAKLSGGERQRIAIARAFLAKTPILILDEATSALDSVTEKYIQQSLEELMEGKTVIAIAHRLSTLAKMDRILVFDQGKVIEDGSHEELLTRQGHYTHMWLMQAGGFMPEAPV